MSDNELIEQVKNGNMDAFEELVKRHKATVFRLAYKSTQNFEDTEDIGQEVFFRIFKAIPGWQPQAEFITYLWHITKAVCVDHYRKKGRWFFDRHFDFDKMEASQESPLESAESSQLIERVETGFGELSGNQRRVLVNRMNGYTFPDVAKIMGMAEGTAKSHYFRAVTKIREGLVDFR